MFVFDIPGELPAVVAVVGAGDAVVRARGAAGAAGTLPQTPQEGRPGQAGQLPGNALSFSGKLSQSPGKNYF